MRNQYWQILHIKKNIKTTNIIKTVADISGDDWQSTDYLLQFWNQKTIKLRTQKAAKAVDILTQIVHITNITMIQSQHGSHVRLCSYLAMGNHISY